MKEPINDSKLNDYVDGLLPRQEAEEVEDYLETSEDARETVAFLRSLKERSERLPASIEPERDLWPEIETRITPSRLMSVDFGRAASATWLPRLGRRQWASLAAAAMVLVVVSSGITAWWLAPSGAFPGSGRASVASGGDPASAVPAAGAVPIDAEYALEIERLRSALYENRDALDPETVTTIEANLRVIDRAIRRARAALDDDPQNPGLTRMLANNYRHKLELLRRANRIIELS